MESFPHGDLTVVGDKGIPLSAGQTVKISLARAVYQDADIYLVDDVFNAIDEKAATQIFSR